MKSAINVVLKVVVMLLLCSLASLGIAAQCTNDGNECAQAVPHFVKFSGTLKISGLSTGVVPLRFVIYRVSNGGTPLWQEVQNVDLDQGKFEVSLGATSSEGIPMTLFESGESRWLGVQALLPGQEEEQRVLLVSVPYAVQAENAQTLGGLPASAFAKVTASTQPGSTESLVPTTIPLYEGVAT